MQGQARTSKEHGDARIPTIALPPGAARRRHSAAIRARERAVGFDLMPLRQAFGRRAHIRHAALHNASTA